MLKAYKYRIYPNNEQKIQIAKTFVQSHIYYVKIFNEEGGSLYSEDKRGLDDKSLLFTYNEQNGNRKKNKKY